MLNHDGSWSPTADTFAALREKINNGTHIAHIKNLPEDMWGVQIKGVGQAYWGEGETCGVKVADEVKWVFEGTSSNR